MDFILGLIQEELGAAIQKSIFYPHLFLDHNTRTFPTGQLILAFNQHVERLGLSPLVSEGALEGGQIGYSWRLRDRFVEGVETDFQGVSSGRNGHVSNVVPLSGVFDRGGTFYFPGERFATSLTANKRIDYFGTVRGRLGWLATPKLLLSGTGGLVYGRLSSSTSITQTNNDNAFFPPGFSLNPQSFSSGSYSGTRFGWTMGTNAEWRFLPNWSARLEYLYYDMGSIRYAVSPTVVTASYTAGAISVVDSQVSTRFNGNIIRVGVNYHFC